MKASRPTIHLVLDWAYRLAIGLVIHNTKKGVINLDIVQRVAIIAEELNNTGWLALEVISTEGVKENQLSIHQILLPS